MREFVEIASTFALESPEPDSRRVGGVAVPFHTLSSPTMFAGMLRRHRFAPGAFTRTIAERGDKVKLFAQHDTSQLPIGRPVELAETDEGLRVAFELADTAAGNDALQLVRDGYVTGFSVGVGVVSYREDGANIVHTESMLREVSLTHEPAFEDARAVAASAEAGADSPIPVEHARRRLALLEKVILK